MVKISVLLHVYGQGQGLQRVDAAEVVRGQDDGVELGHYLRQDLQALDSMPFTQNFTEHIDAQLEENRTDRSAVLEQNVYF